MVASRLGTYSIWSGSVNIVAYMAYVSPQKLQEKKILGILSYRCLHGKLWYLQQYCVGDTLIYQWPGVISTIQGGMLHTDQWLHFEQHSNRVPLY